MKARDNGSHDLSSLSLLTEKERKKAAVVATLSLGLVIVV